MLAWPVGCICYSSETNLLVCTAEHDNRAHHLAHIGRVSVWLASPAMPMRSATRLDRTYFRCPGSLISAVFPWRRFAEAHVVPQSQVALGLLAYEAGKGRPTIRDIHYCALRETAEPADLARAKSTSWLTQSASKGKTQTGCKSLSSEAVKMPRSRSSLVQKDACLTHLFLAASLHSWDLLPSKSLKSNQPHEQRSSSAH